MSDARRLREYLGAALLLVACSDRESAPAPTGSTTPSVPITTTRAAPSIDAGTAITATPTPMRPDPPSRPTCPSVSWCGPVEDAKLLADTTEVKGVCPVEISDLQRGGKTRAVVPPSWHHEGVFMKLDMEGTSTTQCCYTYTKPCPGGRALIVDGMSVCAPTRGTTDDALANAWLADALAEHASIASFARAVIELMAVGGPASLLDELTRAMRDEVSHAALCFGLASRFAGTTLGPGPLPAAPPRDSDLVRFACDTFTEGCVGETVAVLAATRAKEGCEDPEVASVLERIIEDETRHAALAWRTLAWACVQGGDRVRDAVRALAVPPERAAAHEGDKRLGAFGRLDEAGALSAERDAWRDIISPILEQVLAQRDASFDHVVIRLDA